MARTAAANEEKLYKIGEVCKVADVQPYVLRYWETEFPQLSPNKSGGGQRLYTRAELDVILRIKELLYKEGFTIAGAKKRLELEMSDPPAAQPETMPLPATAPIASDTLANIRSELRAILAMLAR